MSVPKRRVVIAPEARSDLRDASVFTERRWGTAQRRLYRQQLLDAFAELAAFPELGRARPEYGAAIRSHRVGQHVVLYQPDETLLRVVRVLHVRRDPDRGLEDASP